MINDGLTEIEADQKHLPQLLEDLGLVRGNIGKIPRLKLSATEADALENSPILEREQATLFRSGTMRCAYLGTKPCGRLRGSQVSGTSNVETESWSHDAVETLGEVPERSAKAGTAVPRTETK